MVLYVLVMQKLEWLGFSNNPVELKEALIEAQDHGMASCLLTVQLDSAKNLPVSQPCDNLREFNFHLRHDLEFGQVRIL